jgi:hypothetical protein
MKFIIIIITLAVAYLLVKITNKSKKRDNITNNMILCNECGFHVPKNNKCTSLKEIYKCKNKK